MKALARLNRGAVLTTGVLLAVIVYLWVTAAFQNAAKPAIRQFCADYIKTEVRYSLLPEQYRLAEPNMPEAAKQAYLADMASDLGPFYSQDETIRQFYLKNLKTSLELQMRGIGIIYDFQKTIIRYDAIEFDGNTVKVVLLTQTIYDGPGQVKYGAGHQKAVAETTDTLVLQQENREWRVVYASLALPGQEYDQFSTLQREELAK